MRRLIYLLVVFILIGGIVLTAYAPDEISMVFIVLMEVIIFLGVVFGIGFAAGKVVLKSKLRQKKEAKLHPPAGPKPEESVAPSDAEGALVTEPENVETAVLTADASATDPEKTETKIDVERMEPNGEQ